MFFKRVRLLFCSFALLFLSSCASLVTVINNVDEREANEIIVYLASRNILATKVAMASAMAGASAETRWSISVPQEKATEAMALLNHVGLPRKRGTTLLDLFGASGLMTSATEENIRYQAGLAEQISNMIRGIDGVIDATVQISFPAAEPATATIGTAQTTPKRITAAVYVKHQGVLDDPNSHLISKIKRLVAGSIAGLDINDVTVVSDRARLAELSPTPMIEPLQKEFEYVSIWSIVMTKTSAHRFRGLVFTILVLLILFFLTSCWLLWKSYPLLKKGGYRALLTLAPWPNDKEEKEEEAP